MYLENIKLLNFKNYEELALDFTDQINCFVGDNGAGKTNLLDAIHYLSLTKSAFNFVDTQNIRRGQDHFMVKGIFDLDNNKEIVLCHFKTGQKKVVKHNNNLYDRLSEHIGKFPIVIITPGDQGIIQEGSETRRKYFDSLLSQIYPVYLSNLVRYHYALRQRNTILKQFFERNFIDKDLIEPYTDELILTGREIFKARYALANEYVPILKDVYAAISENRESIGMEYVSDLSKDDFDAQLKDGLKRDIILQRTATGIHRDDFEFLIEDYPMKKFGSQGQQKSFVVALKLAQFEMIKKIRGFKPLLLMDDIFDKLDDKRIAKLMEMVAGHAFGQLFVTDARPERTYKVFENIVADIKMIAISNGKIVKN
jgi:DNA replication and repair protein RecF